MDFIPVNEPLLNGNERQYLSQCIDTGWISSEGPFVRELEERFAARVGRKYGIAVCNGTAALDAAVEALDIGPGDEVILPAFTIISCITQIIRSGATPVLVDSDPMNWNIDVSQIESKITQRTKAIMVVHTYGLPVDMAPVLELASKYGLKIIEDAAEVHGQTYRGKPCGSFGNISTFSFYPNKHITTGEGGMIVTDDESLAETCRSLRNLCFLPKKRFVHERLGWNLRMTNLQAALGVAQLERLDDFVHIKRRLGHRYFELFDNLPGFQQPVLQTEYADNIFWVYGLVIPKDAPLTADEAIQWLSHNGVGCRPFFYPMHLQPVFKKARMFLGDIHPVAENLADKGFYIPSGLGLREDQQNRVAEMVMKLAIERLA